MANNPEIEKNLSLSLSVFFENVRAPPTLFCLRVRKIVNPTMVIGYGAQRREDVECGRAIWKAGATFIGVEAHLM